jgi:hypothetical protein
MLAQTAKHWLGVVVTLALGIGATAPAQGAPATPISVCPYTITAPGNYLVTRNLIANGTCITFDAPVSNVALDLQGHSITGNGKGYGIVCLPSNSSHGCDRVIIANGVVTRLSGGIFLEGNFNTVAEVTSQQNIGIDNGNNPGYGRGIDLRGDSGNVITDSFATGNADIGINGSSMGFGTTVNYSKATNNGSHGIVAAGVVSKVRRIRTEAVASSQKS